MHVRELRIVNRGARQALEVLPQVVSEVADGPAWEGRVRALRFDAESGKERAERIERAAVVTFRRARACDNGLFIFCGDHGNWPAPEKREPAQPSAGKGRVEKKRASFTRKSAEELFNIRRFGDFL
jgi:hypothetical protein